MAPGFRKFLSSNAESAVTHHRVVSHGVRQESGTTRIVAVRCFRVSEVGSKGVAPAVQVQLKPVEMRVAVVVSVVDRQVRPVPGTPSLKAGKSNTRQKLAFDTQWPSEFFCCFRNSSGSIRVWNRSWRGRALTWRSAFAKTGSSKYRYAASRISGAQPML